jgi:hypothetical protein
MVLSTRSVDMSLARPFKAGKVKQNRPRRVATHETGSRIQSSLSDENRNDLIPALKRRAKLMPTLRVEDTELPKVYQQCRSAYQKF